MSHFVNIDPKWAWQPYQPDAENRWDLHSVGHLYRRAGFGASYQQLQDGVKTGHEATIARLLQGDPGQEAFEAQMTTLSQGVVAGNNPIALRAWWLFRCVHTPHPLREKLTLFWHNHFATSNAKVNNLRYMLGQNELLRRHATGSFRALLQYISKDPAMVIWLDTNQSKKGMPNENYARELMELFSLGIGNYTETDIREAARAFTGWQLRDDKFHFQADDHDNTEKTVLGRKGKWSGEDIVNICLEQKSAPFFIVRKLFRYLISESITPSQELLTPLAQRFRKSDFAIFDLVETMLRSNLFFSEHSYRSVVKSPTDFSIQILRGLEGRLGTIALAQAMENLGQRLFYPPSVKGWDGGESWLNSATLLQRHNLVQALTSTEDDRFGRRIDPAALATRFAKLKDDEVVSFFADLFLDGKLGDEQRRDILAYLEKARKHKYPVFWSFQDIEEQRIRTACYLILTQPEFQLG